MSDTEKLCTTCKVPLPSSQFYKHKRTSDGLFPSCKPCARNTSRQWTANNPDKRKERELLARYGISLEQYNTLLKAQNGLCAICFNPPSAGTQSLYVDHCHITKKVRGLLCNKCNQALGLMRDSAAILNNAIQYLAKAMN